MTETKMSAQQMLEAHVAAWDMPTLAEQHPAVMDHLAAKYDVVFPEMFSGQVYVVHKAEGHRMEKMGTTDVREAVKTLLEREVSA